MKGRPTRGQSASQSEGLPEIQPVASAQKIHPKLSFPNSENYHDRSVCAARSTVFDRPLRTLGSGGDLNAHARARMEGSAASQISPPPSGGPLRRRRRRESGGDASSSSSSVGPEGAGPASFPVIPLKDVGKRVEWRPHRDQRDALATAFGDELYKEDDASEDLGHGAGNIFYGIVERKDVDLSKYATASTWRRWAKSPIWIRAYVVLSLGLLYFSTALNALVFVQLNGLWYVNLAPSPSSALCSVSR